MSHLFLLLAGLGATHYHAPLATWERCSSRAGCRWFGMPKVEHRPTGHVHFCTTSPAVTICVTYPQFAPKAAHRAILPVKSATRTAPIIRATVQRVGGRIELWYVTWYAATGNKMSNGLYPAQGWAACGYDVALGTRVIVPGLGTFTCGDRMCRTCPGVPFVHHIDIFNIPLGTGYRWVTVIP